MNNELLSIIEAYKQKQQRYGVGKQKIRIKIVVDESTKSINTSIMKAYLVDTKKMDYDKLVEETRKLNSNESLINKCTTKKLQKKYMENL